MKCMILIRSCFSIVWWKLSLGLTFLLQVAEKLEAVGDAHYSLGWRADTHAHCLLEEHLFSQL